MQVCYIADEDGGLIAIIEDTQISNLTA